MFYYNFMLLFVFGLIMGSFLSVIIGRIETGESIVVGGSKCPKCKKKIRYYDLVPVFSFLVLKGRCRDCQQKISLFYPVIELVTGFLFAFLYWRFHLSFSGADYWIFFATSILAISSLVVVFFYDLFYSIVPDKVVLPASLIILVLALANIIFGLDFFVYPPHWGNLILGIIFGAGIFLALVLVSREKWMGWGDVKLGALLGVFLGYPLILVALFFAFIIGTISSVVLMLMGKKTRKDTIPFGPFLVVGGLIALFLGKWILIWYLGL